MLGLSLVVGGCGNDFTIRDRGDDGDLNTPAIKVEPRTLEFPPTTSLDTVTQTLTISNVGLSSLSIDRFDFAEHTAEGEGSYVVSFSEDAPLVLPIRETVEVDVTFQPLLGGALPAELLILSDDRDTPELTVPITGVGQMPRLIVEPDPIDLEDPAIPCEVDKTVVIKNIGPEPAVIDGAFFDGQGSELVSFGSPLPEPLTLSENSQQLATVTLSPSRKMRVTASMALDSNDPRGVVRTPVVAETRFVTEGSKTFEIPERFPVDLVFGIDQSGSMQGLKASLRNQFESFIVDLENATLDWRIGVVTHDRGGSLRGCFNGGSSGAITNLPGWQTQVRNALFPTAAGVEDRLTEAQLAAVALGLDKAGSGECNAGFGQGRNPNNPPPLHVIVVSNERDQSEFEEVEQMFSPPRSISSSAANRAQAFVQDYQAWAGSIAEVKVHGVLDVTSNPPTISPCGGVRAGAMGYRDAVDATGGFLMDICYPSDWGAAFASIAQDVIQGAQALRLGVPDVWPDSVSVTVDGTRQDEGWEYDPGRNAVVFDDPPRGSTVEVSYGVAARCR